METEAAEYIRRIDAMGGIVRAIELGFPQQEIADAAYRYQQQLDHGDKVVVGVNKYKLDAGPPLEILRIDPAIEERQVARVRAFKQTRNQARAHERLAAVRRACSDGENLMPPLIAAVKEGVTLGEICDVYREEFGVYHDPAWL
jgi:methylmalonyl-CoA mutase N-terminal domain/subunit